MNKFLLVALLALSLASCGQLVTPAPPTSIPPALELAEDADDTAVLEALAVRNPAQQKADIEATVSGLLYLSESERPWTYNATPKPKLSDWLASWTGSKVEKRRTFKAFFKQLENPDNGPDAARYKSLEAVLRKNFTSLLVYWVTDPANPVKVRLVILGKNRLGVFALETVSIET